MKIKILILVCLIIALSLIGFGTFEVIEEKYNLDNCTYFWVNDRDPRILTGDGKIIENDYSETRHLLKTKEVCKRESLKAGIFLSIFFIIVIIGVFIFEKKK